MQNSENTPPLLEVRDLRVSYGIGGGVFSRAKKFFNAVDGVSFSIGRGEIVGLVGESGSGKTTTGRSIIRLAPISGGEIFYEGKKISDLPNADFMPYRKKNTDDISRPVQLAKPAYEHLADNIRATRHTF